MLLTPAKSGWVTNSVIGTGCAPKHTKGSTMENRKRLWDDFINEFDSTELHDGNGSTCSPNTNLKGSEGTIWLHEDSMSGIPHLNGSSAASTDRDASTTTMAHTCGNNVRPRNEAGRQTPGYGRRTSGR